MCEDELYTEAAEFYATKLGIPENTIIGIALHSDLDIAGYCQKHDDEALPYYLVGIDERILDGEEHPLSILAHEMVHIKQYVSGELVDTGTKCLWKGQEYEEYVPSSEEYFFSPWEVEAFGMQVGLFHLYMKGIE